MKTPSRWASNVICLCLSISLLCLARVSAVRADDTTLNITIGSPITTTDGKSYIVIPHDASKWTSIPITLLEMGVDAKQIQYDIKPVPTAISGVAFGKMLNGMLVPIADMNNIPKASVKGSDLDNPTILQLSGLSSEEYTLTATVNAKSKTITIIVRDASTSLQVHNGKRTDPAINSNQTLALPTGGNPTQITATLLPDGKGLITFTSDLANSVGFSLDPNSRPLSNDPLKVREGTPVFVFGLKSQSGTVNFTVSSTTEPTISQSVSAIIEAPAAKIIFDPDSLIIIDGEQKPIKAIVQDSNGNQLQREITWTPVNELTLSSTTGTPVTVSAVAGNAGKTVQLKASVQKPGIDTAPLNSVLNVNILPKANKIVVDSPQSNSVLVNTDLKLKLRYLTVDGREITDSQLLQEQLSVTNDIIPEKPQILTVFNDPGDKTGRSYIARGTDPGDVTLTFHLKDKAGNDVAQGGLLIHIVAVQGFTPVRVALDIMDETTAGYLFGKRTSQEFYVVRVRLFNNLDKDPTGKFQGQSILAYSESIEAGVAIEKRYDKGSKSRLPDKTFPNDYDSQNWNPVTEEEFQTRFTHGLENPENFVSSQDRNRLTPKSVNAIPTVAMVPGEILHLQLFKNLSPVDLNQIGLQTSNANIVNFDRTTNVVTAGSVTGQAILTGTFEGHTYGLVINVCTGMKHAERTVMLQPALSITLGDELTVRTDEKGALWQSSDAFVADVNSKTGKVGLHQSGVVALVANGQRSSYILLDIQAKTSQAVLPPSVDSQLHYLRHRFRYRPYTFDMMINSLDPREEHSSRALTFKYLGLAGTLASFMSTIKLLDKSGSYITDTYNGLLLPNLAKIFPDMRDTQRQNFVSMVMKPIEEIPFGSDIARVLFFPKQPFRGLVPGHFTRISEIDTSYFNITVAVVNKNNTQSVQAGNGQ